MTTYATAGLLLEPGGRPGPPNLPDHLELIVNQTAPTAESRDFDLADILTMTTGLLLSRRHMDGVYDIANWMTGDNLMTHQLPRAADLCGPALLKQHPQLRDVEPPRDIDVPDLMTWLANAELQHGERLPVAQLPAGTWEHQDPIEELCDMVGPERVIVAELPSKEN